NIRRTHQAVRGSMGVRVEFESDHKKDEGPLCATEDGCRWQVASGRELAPCYLPLATCYLPPATAGLTGISSNNKRRDENKTNIPSATPNQRVKRRMSRVAEAAISFETPSVSSNIPARL